jgi:hypothetical protein
MIADPFDEDAEVRSHLTVHAGSPFSVEPATGMRC